MKKACRLLYLPTGRHPFSSGMVGGMVGGGGGGGVAGGPVDASSLAIAFSNGYSPLLQRSPLKSSKSNVHINTPPNLKPTQNGYKGTIKGWFADFMLSG